MPTAECEQAPPPAPAHPSPQTVVDYIDISPPAARLFNCLNLERLILTVGLWRWKTMDNSSSGEFGGAFASAAYDEAALLKTQAFFRR